MRLTSALRRSTRPSRSPRPPHRRSGRLTGPLLVVLGAVLTAVVAIAGNVVANRLPDWLSQWALPVFLIGSLLSVVVGVVIYRNDRQQAESAEPGDLAERDRARLLDRVAAQTADLLWLPAEDPPRLPLPLQPRADLVAAPRQRFAERLAELGERPSVGAIFEQAEDALLVVGDPGSGKSRWIAELGAHLVGLARADPEVPVPVLVSLASWAPANGSLDVWLAQQLHERYDVPAGIASALVSAGRVQPLLDGLDESADVGACVAGINQFRAGYGLVPIVVCSRLTEYEQAGGLLRLRAAVQLLPPRPSDVRRYLEQAGLPASIIDELTGEMGELVSTPLTLGLIARTARSGGVAQLASGEDRAARWAPLFETYIDRMLRRARDPAPGPARVGYADADVRRWLSWLAAVTREHDLAQFRLDRLQPEWLPPDAFLTWQRLLRLRRGVLRGGFWALCTGLPVAWGAQFLPAPASWWLGLLVGAAVGLIMGLRSRSSPVPPVRIEPAEVLRFDSSMLPTVIALAVVVTFATAIVGGVVLAVIALVQGAPVWSSLLSGERLWTVVVITIVFLLGASATMVRSGLAPASRVPNEGIRRSLRHAALVACAAAPVAAAAMLTLRAFTTDSSQSLPSIALFAAGIGLSIGYSFGASAVIAHFVVRGLLVRAGCAPWRYVRFLNFAAERVLLRRVGGAYEFIHPTLRDHLADHPTA